MLVLGPRDQERDLLSQQIGEATGEAEGLRLEREMLTEQVAALKDTHKRELTEAQEKVSIRCIQQINCCKMYCIVLQCRTGR